jgi:hypothetical protein
MWLNPCGELNYLEVEFESLKLTKAVGSKGGEVFEETWAFFD